MGLGPFSWFGTATKMCIMLQHIANALEIMNLINLLKDESFVF